MRLVSLVLVVLAGVVGGGEARFADRRSLGPQIFAGEDFIPVAKAWGKWCKVHDRAFRCEFIERWEALYYFESEEDRKKVANQFPHADDMPVGDFGGPFLDDWWWYCPKCREGFKRYCARHTEGKRRELVEQIKNIQEEKGWQKKYGAELLTHAAGLGDSGLIRELVKKGCDVNAADKWGGTALHLAVENGEIEAVKTLIELGADVNARETDSGEAALHIAAKWKLKEMIELLVPRGADINAVCTDGWTPLMWGDNHPEIRQFLEDNGAGYDPNYLRIAEETGGVNNEANRQKLHEAVLAEEYAAAKRWVEKGVVPEAGSSWLQEYIKKDDWWERDAPPGANMIRLLVKLRADLHGGEDRLEPLLHFVVDEAGTSLLDWRPAIRALVEAGADVDERDSDPYTPLGTAILCPELVRVLLELGADPDVKGSFLKEPLIFEAVFWGDVETAWLLVKAGVDLTVPNEAGQRPLEFAEWLTLEKREEAVRKRVRTELRIDESEEEQRYRQEYFEKRRKAIVAILRGAKVKKQRTEN